MGNFGSTLTDIIVLRMQFVLKCEIPAKPSVILVVVPQILLKRLPQV